MVRIVTLLENTKESPKLSKKHGLSLYIETKRHKFLFDMGPNALFLKNALLLGIDVSDIDIAVLSHGHIDHCGGLKCFLAHNHKAKVYVRKEALEKYYVKVFGIPFYAGIDQRLLSSDRFVFTEDVEQIDEKLTLFSNVGGEFPLPKSDSNLFMKRDGKIMPDDFGHEQNLLIQDGEDSILLCGCARAGIVNIVKTAKELLGYEPKAVIGGTHLFEPTKRRYEKKGYIEAVGSALAATNSFYYVCHCTGLKAFETMKLRLNGRLAYLSTGSDIRL